MTSPIFCDRDDPAMTDAFAGARASFRYFWRELSWERRRIIPAWDTVCVKIAVSEGELVEHMWLDELEFDGDTLNGTLRHDAHQLEDVREGDTMSVAAHRIEDWIIGNSKEVYGGFTVQLLRSRLAIDACRNHDRAWGLGFGDPRDVQLPYATEHHPMDVNMRAKFASVLAEDPPELRTTDEAGFTWLHNEALAGNAILVELLLDHGADPCARSPNGRTPRDLARAVGWRHVDALLAAAGGT